MARYSKVVLLNPTTLNITGYTNIQTAIDNASSGNTILVYPSTYEEQITLKNGVDIFCYPGVLIKSDSPAATIIDGGVKCVSKFVGDYSITNTGGGVAISFTHPETNVYTGEVDFNLGLDAGYIPKSDGEGSLIESNIFQSGSFIGINTTTPSANLHIDGSVIAGSNNIASGSRSYAFGEYTFAGGDYSFVAGSGSVTYSPYSAVFGMNNRIMSGSEGAFVIGLNNLITSGNYGFIQGKDNLIANKYADPTVTNHVEGIANTALGNGGHAEGFANTTEGWCSHAEGDVNLTLGAFSHAEGGYGTAIGFRTHTEGRGTTAVEWYAHSEGVFTIGLGYGCHAEGRSTMAGPTGSYMCSHAEGYTTTTFGQYSHSEGSGTSAVGIGSHAEGQTNTSVGSYSHAEGSNTRSVGQHSHSEGHYTTAIGQYSHAEGYYTITSGSYSHVQGAYNQINTNSYSFIIGNGTSTSNRSNLVYASGSRFEITGSLRVSGSIPQVIISGLPVYADNASAIAGGLTTSGSLYRTSTGVLMVTY